MKIKYLILCFVASLLASCGEIDESNLKLYPSKLYLGVSGYTFCIYNRLLLNIL